MTPFAALLTLALAQICLLGSHAYTQSATESRLLVVLDDDSIKTSHSQLLDSLRAKGFDLDLQLASSSDISLQRDGAYVYSGIALLCPTSPTISSSLPASKLTAFLDSGRDIFLAAAPVPSTYTKSVAQLMGVDLADAPLIDHVRPFAGLDGGDHTFIHAGGRVPSTHMFGNAALDGQIAFKGPGATLFRDNELVDSVMWGSGSAYAGQVGKKVRGAQRAVGSQAVMAAALATRANSRAVYFGSLQALSDGAFQAAGSDHAEALASLAAWTYGHAGVLEMRDVRHFARDSDGMQQDSYRVKDVLVFEARIVEWDGASREWRPFQADDVQIVFVMLNPWVRTRLRPDTSNETGLYRAEVQVPDQIGVYKFAVEYYRPGVSHISFAQVVPIRPYLHNEYKRFIVQAYPYYATSFSMLVGVLLLGVVLLYGNTGEDLPKGKGNIRAKKNI